MEDLKQFNIPFVGLKEESHLFEYQINNTFFEFFQFDDFFSSNIKVSVNLLKKSTLLELLFVADGIVNIPCDVTNEPFNQKIEATLPLIVKFGPKFNDDNDEVLILPYGEYQINIAQYIYEMIILAIPLKRIHPKVLDGTMDSDILRKIEKLKINKPSVEEKTTTDPRWDKLKNLLTDKIK